MNTFVVIAGVGMFFGAVFGLLDLNVNIGMFLGFILGAWVAIRRPL